MKTWMRKGFIRFTIPLSFFGLFYLKALGGPMSNCASQVPFYSMCFSTEYSSAKNHRPQSVFTLSIKGKEQWKKKADYPFTKTLVDRETGDLFCEIDHPVTGEIRAYTPSGVLLMERKGRLLAVSPGGNFVAYQLPGKVTEPGQTMVLVARTGHLKPEEFPIGNGFAVKALADNGKYLLLGAGEPDPSRTDYCLVDNRNHPIWELKGKGVFSGMEGHGHWLVISRSVEKTVDYYDFKTGKLLKEIPLWKYKVLHNHPAAKPGSH